MKPKLKWGLIAAVPVALFLGLGMWLGSRLQLTGLAFQLFWVGFGVLGAIVGGALYWFLGRSRPRREPEPPDPLEEDLGARLAEVHDRLASADRPGFERLPAVLLLGPPGSGKSSAVLGSEVAAEQLTGDPVRGEEVAPTRSINAWYSDGTILLEAASDVRQNASVWSKLLHRLRPRRLLAAILTGEPQSPRAAVVCFGCDELTRDGAVEATVGWARSLRSSLLEVCATLGIQIPVYVLFTKADEIPSFPEYAAQLGDAASRQVLGVTLPPSPSHTAASYVDRQYRLLMGSFQELFRSLALKRLKFMSPDLDSHDDGRVYEFPREFKKLSDVASRFLVELCKPSQLRLSPFLRGFYFTGWQQLTAEEELGAEPEQVTRIPAGGATQVFDPGKLSEPSETPAFRASTGPRTRHRWLFLPRVFRDVILRDDIAVGMMRKGERVSLGRRLLLGTALLAVVFVLLPWLFVAFSASRDRQHGVDRALQELRLGASAAASSGEVLERLDVVRGKADTLATELSRSGFLRTVRWLGLYPGAKLYPAVVENYFLRFDPLLLDPALESVEAELAALPDVPTPSSDYQASYNRLRAYLMSTRYPDRGEPEFLGDVLTSHWGRARTQEASALARAQFEFFGRHLRGSPLVDRPGADGELVTRTRRFLGRLGGAEPFYLSLVYRANQSFPPVRFGAATSNPLLTPREVPGAFSSEGRRFVKELLSAPDSLPLAEEWVLGDSAVYDMAPMVRAIDSLYEAAFRDQWQDLLLETSVASFASPADASDKLDELAGDGSLLGLIQPVYEKVQEMPDPYRGRFEALGTFLAVDSAGNVEGPSELITNYLVSLEELGRSMADLADAPAGAKLAMAEEIRTGDVLAEADEAAEELERELGRSREGRQLAAHLSTLLRGPIRQTELLLGRVGPAVLASWNREFCGQYGARVGSKYPFNPRSGEEPSLDNLLEVFRPGGSLLSDHLDRLSPYVTRQGFRYRNAQEDVRIGGDFLDFLSRAHRFSEAIFGPSGETPIVRFNLLPKPAESDRRVQSIILTTQAGRQECTRTDCRTTAAIEWDGSSDVELFLSVRLEGSTRPEPVTDTYRGPWAPFRFFSGTSGWGGPEERRHLVRWPIPGVGGQVAVEVTDIVPRSVWVFNPDVLRRLRCP